MMRAPFFPLLLIAGLITAPPVLAWPDDPFGAMADVAAPACRETRNQPLSLADVVDLALCANPSTREAWANARYQAALVGVAQSARLPELSADVSTWRNRSAGVTTREKQAGLALSWIVYDFGARGSAVDSARHLLAAANANRDSTLQAVRQAAVQAYFQVQATEAALAATRKSEQAFAESYKASEERHQVGIATPADKLQAQTALSQARLQRIRAEGALRTAQGVLANTIGRVANESIAVATAAEVGAGAEFNQDVGALIALAGEQRPDLIAAEAKWRSADADVDVARASGLPTLSLAATGARSKLDSAPWTNGSSVGLVLDIPLFTGFYDTYRIRTAEARREAQAAARDRMRSQVSLDVWTAYQNLVTANQSLRSTADLIASAERSEEVTLGRYKNGVGSILDLLTAQSALATARQQRVAALYDWNVSRTALAFAIGNLDMDLIDRLALAINNEKVAP
jgi:TolC family type I secretion outer membrane protein